jgi:hypothetical protein
VKWERWRDVITALIIGLALFTLFAVIGLFTDDLWFYSFIGFLLCTFVLLFGVVYHHESTTYQCPACNGRGYLFKVDEEGDE